MMIRFTRLQLKDSTKFDAVVMVMLSTGIVYPEEGFTIEFPSNDSMNKRLRTANITAISIMAKIFY